MDELDGDVPRVRPRRRRAADGEQAPATAEALRHLVAERRDAVRLGGEERAVRLRPRAEEDVDAVRRRGRSGGGGDASARPHAGAPVLVASRASQSRQASVPSPVRALISMCGTPGWTDSRW